MYQEKRPTCITVIGWAWIILGGLMCFSSVMGLFAFIMTQGIPSASSEIHQDLPVIFRLFPLLAVLQMGIAVSGLVSGINFLKFKPWSRTVLEMLTWLLIVFVLVFGGFFIFQWISTSSKSPSFGFGIMEAAMVFGILGIYGAPLAIMVKYLRGDKVKNAIKSSAGSSGSFDKVQPERKA